MRFFVQLDDGTQVPIYSINELEGADKTKEIIFCLTTQTGYSGRFVSINNGHIMISIHNETELIFPSHLIFGWFYKEG